MKGLGMNVNTEVLKNEKGEAFLSIEVHLGSKMRKLIILDMLLVGIVHLGVYYLMFQQFLTNTVVIIGLSLLFSSGIARLNFQNIDYFIRAQILSNLIRSQVNDEVLKDDELVEEKVDEKALLLHALKDAIQEFKWISMGNLFVILAEIGLIVALASSNAYVLFVLILTVWKGIILHLMRGNFQKQKRTLRRLKSEVAEEPSLG